MHRPIWKGFITFGLVNIPVTLYAAEKRTQQHFHLVDGRNNARIHYQRINDDTGKEVPWDSIVKAYEYEKGNYVILKDDELKGVAIEASQTIEIINFVNEIDINDIYFDKPYYLVPEKKAIKGYVLLHKALQHTKKIGIAKVVIRTRQYLCAVQPSGTSLMLDLLRYSDEIVPAAEFDFPDKKLSDYKISDNEVKLAEQLIAQMTTEWDASEYKDDYQMAVMKLIEKKVKHKGKLPCAKKLRIKSSDNVIDFVSAIKKSLSTKKVLKKSAATTTQKKKSK